MEWRIWITWWIIFCIRYSKLIWTYLENNGEKNDNRSIRKYVDKIENRIIFKIKIGYYLELFTHETMKLLGSTKDKITKYGNCENVLHLEISEVVLVHYNIVNNDY